VKSSDGPFYCAADQGGTVFLPLVGIKRLVFPGSTFRKYDFALSYVVAHEWGHHVQSRLKLFAGKTSVQIELQADCLAGVWAYSVWARQLLEPGDIEEAVSLAALVGDAPGTSPNNADAHGSSKQRVNAFKRGYRSGRAGVC
jgi:predicted metalloprotease